MHRLPSPFTEPTLRADLPTYPLVAEVLRVGAATVPGPSGYGSSSVLGPLLYVAAVCQVRTDTLLPRDRIPCLALDLNGAGLAPGYYTNGRLVGSYQSLPVYGVGAAAAATGGLTSGAGGGGTAVPPPALPGLTQAQYNSLVLNLSPAQVSVLNNLNTCQLQTFVTALTVSQQQILTGALTSTQLSNYVGYTTPTQLTNLTTALNVPQVQKLATALTPVQVLKLVQTLTATQISTLANETSTGLTTVQLQTLTQYPPATIGTLVTALSTANLKTFLNASPVPADPVVGSPSLQAGATSGFGWLPTVLNTPTGVPNPLLTGYAPVAVNSSSNQLSIYSGGAWQNFSAGGGSSSVAVNSTPISGGTTGYILYDNGGTVGEENYVPLGHGGTGGDLSDVSSLVGSYLSTSTAVTLANSTTETSLLGTVRGSQSAPANYWAAGTALWLRAGGTIGVTGVPTITLKWKLGTGILAQLAASPTGITGASWDVDIVVTVRTTGAAATATVVGFLRVMATPGASPFFWSWTTTAVTFDTTATANLDLTAQWSTNQILDTITCNSVMMALLKT